MWTWPRAGRPWAQFRGSSPSPARLAGPSVTTVRAQPLLTGDSKSAFIQHCYRETAGVPAFPLHRLSLAGGSQLAHGTACSPQLQPLPAPQGPWRGELSGRSSTSSGCRVGSGTPSCAPCCLVSPTRLLACHFSADTLLCMRETSRTASSAGIWACPGCGAIRTCATP